MRHPKGGRCGVERPRSGRGECWGMAAPYVLSQFLRRELEDAVEFAAIAGDDRAVEGNRLCGDEPAIPTNRLSCRFKAGAQFSIDRIDGGFERKGHRGRPSLAYAARVPRILPGYSANAYSL